MTHSSTQPNQPTTTYDWIRRVLLSLVILLFAVVAVTPGVLRLLYRADAQVAATERYGQNRTFSDASSQGGVAEGIYEEVLQLSKAPGDFWVLRMSEDGYTLEQFIYQEGEFTVWYESDPSSYRVYHEEQMTGAAAASEE